MRSPAPIHDLVNHQVPVLSQQFPLRRQYKGYPLSTESKHCALLIRQYIHKLACWVAEMAKVPPEAVNNFEHSMPWVNATDAPCIEALYWYYTNYANNKITPKTYHTNLWALSDVQMP